MSRGFPGGGGQTSENCEVGNRDGVFVSKTTENVELFSLFILKTIMANYGWKLSLLLLWMQ